MRGSKPAEGIVTIKAEDCATPELLAMAPETAEEALAIHMDNRANEAADIRNRTAFLRAQEGENGEHYQELVDRLISSPIE